MQLLRSQGIDLSPLFSCPSFSADFICIDVLHALDLGVTQEVLGSIFWESLGVFAKGRNRALQVAELFRLMKEHYVRVGTSNRLSNLTVEMIK